MKVLFSLLIALLLFPGCSYDVKYKEIQWAEKVCETNGGLSSMLVWDDLYPNARCNNGAEFSSTKKSYTGD